MIADLTLDDNIGDMARRRQRARRPDGARATGRTTGRAERR